MSCLLLLGIILLDNDILHCLLCYTLYSLYTQSYKIDASNRISVDELGFRQNASKEDDCFYTVNSEIENLNDLLTDGDELLKVNIMISVEEEQAVHQRHTDKKEKKIFFTYKEIHMGSAAKSYMRKSFIIYEEMHK